MLAVRILLAILVAAGPQNPRLAEIPAKIDGSITAPASKPVPFQVGEVLTYEASFSKFVLSGTIGELRLSVLPSSDPERPNLLELRADASSKGFFPALLGLKVKDRLTALVSPVDFGLEVSHRQVEENKIRREYRSVIDRTAGRVLFTDTDKANSTTAKKVIEAPSPGWIQDVLSTIYYTRTLPLKDNDVYQIPISDLGNVYNIEIAVVKREEVKVGARAFKAIQLDARIFNGRYIRRKGELTVWIGDDERRIPLRAKLKTSGYTATVELKKIP